MQPCTSVFVGNKAVGSRGFEAFTASTECQQRFPSKLFKLSVPQSQHSLRPMTTFSTVTVFAGSIHRRPRRRTQAAGSPEGNAEPASQPGAELKDQPTPDKLREYILANAWEIIKPMYVMCDPFGRSGYTEELFQKVAAEEGPAFQDTDFEPVLEQLRQMDRTRAPKHREMLPPTTNIFKEAASALARTTTSSWIDYAGLGDPEMAMRLLTEYMGPQADEMIFRPGRPAVCALLLWDTLDRPRKSSYLSDYLTVFASKYNILVGQARVELMPLAGHLIASPLVAAVLMADYSECLLQPEVRGERVRSLAAKVKAMELRWPQAFLEYLLCCDEESVSKRLIIDCFQAASWESRRGGLEESANLHIASLLVASLVVGCAHQIHSNYLQSHLERLEKIEFKQECVLRDSTLRNVTLHGQVSSHGLFAHHVGEEEDPSNPRALCTFECTSVNLLIMAWKDPLHLWKLAASGSGAPLPVCYEAHEMTKAHFKGPTGANRLTGDKKVRFSEDTQPILVLMGPEARKRNVICFSRARVDGIWGHLTGDGPCVYLDEQMQMSLIEEEIEPMVWAAAEALIPSFKETIDNWLQENNQESMDALQSNEYIQPCLSIQANGMIRSAMASWTASATDDGENTICTETLWDPRKATNNTGAAGHTQSVTDLWAIKGGVRICSVDVRVPVIASIKARHPRHQRAQRPQKAQKAKQQQKKRRSSGKAGQQYLSDPPSGGDEDWVSTDERHQLRIDVLTDTFMAALQGALCQFNHVYLLDVTSSTRHGWEWPEVNMLHSIYPLLRFDVCTVESLAEVPKWLDSQKDDSRNPAATSNNIADERVAQGRSASGSLVVLRRVSYDCSAPAVLQSCIEQGQLEAELKVKETREPNKVVFLNIWIDHLQVTLNDAALKEWRSSDKPKAADSSNCDKKQSPITQSVISEWRSTANANREVHRKAKSLAGLSAKLNMVSSLISMDGFPTTTGSPAPAPPVDSGALDSALCALEEEMDAQGQNAKALIPQLWKSATMTISMATEVLREHRHEALVGGALVAYGRWLGELSRAEPFLSAESMQAAARSIAPHSAVILEAEAAGPAGQSANHTMPQLPLVDRLLTDVGSAWEAVGAAVKLVKQEGTSDAVSELRDAVQAIPPAMAALHGRLRSAAQLRVAQEEVDAAAVLLRDCESASKAMAAMRLAIVDLAEAQRAVASKWEELGESTETEELREVLLQIVQTAEKAAKSSGVLSIAEASPRLAVEVEELAANCKAEVSRARLVLQLQKALVEMNIVEAQTLMAQAEEINLPIEWAVAKIDEILDQLRQLQLLSASQAEAQSPLAAALPTAKSYAPNPTWHEVGTDGKIAFSDATEDVLGMGSNQTYVFKGVYRETSRQETPAAIKRVQIPLLDENREVMSFIEREVQLMSDLSGSPHICGFFGWNSEERSHVYIAMELCKENLKSYIERESPSLDGKRRLRLVEDLTDCLVFLHGGGTGASNREPIVHNDLKPENILIANHGKAKLTDVQLSVKMAKERKMFSMTTFANYGVSINYENRAPEVLQGGTNLTPAVDVWNMGMVFFYCLTGEASPYVSLRSGQEINPMEESQQQSKIIGGEYDLSSLHKGHLSPRMAMDAEMLLKSMLEPDYTLRPSAKAIKEHSLFWTNVEVIEKAKVVHEEISRDRKVQAQLLSLLRTTVDTSELDNWQEILSTTVTDPFIKFLHRASDSKKSQQCRSGYASDLLGLLRFIRNAWEHPPPQKTLEDALRAIQPSRGSVVPTGSQQANQAACDRLVRPVRPGAPPVEQTTKRRNSRVQQGGAKQPRVARMQQQRIVLSTYLVAALPVLSSAVYVLLKEIRDSKRNE